MTVMIHNRPYVTVAERLSQVHAAGKSLEVVDSQPIQCGERWVWRTHIVLDGKQYIGSAEVHLAARPGSADATDPFACAETSAVGRALAFAGILSSEGIASADEMQATSAPSGGQDGASGDTLAEQIAALKSDFEALYPEKAGIWNAVLTRQFGKIPQRWTQEGLVKMRGYYLQCQAKVESRKAVAQTDAA